MLINKAIDKTIGNTPLVRLNRTNSNIDAQIWAKLEFFNPLTATQ